MAIVGFVGIVMITTAAILATIATVSFTEDRRVMMVVFAATFVSSAVATAVLVRLLPVRMSWRVPPGHRAVIIRAGVPTVVPQGEAPGLLQPVYAIVPVGEITYSCRAHFLDSGTRERKIEQRIVIRYQITKPAVATEWQSASYADRQMPREPVRAFVERQINTEVRIAFEQIPLDAVEEKLANRVELAKTLGGELRRRHQDHGIETTDVQLGFCRIRQ